ncbi:hypothetical protein BTO06_03980 [Tenacibaculum sp. SZ-18]|uniref:hypothetical protein n=1 Tax=Tenacibaculum sp. SZ-18 TaxID=754423 RepID=UPI000C2D41F8|nr:hypothetical protein [Tenacibaculum sp. SZ-18]AUC14351.1 hypothetical protein BTO06_03980 [Tenacibaculum sp. SZ-18]
MKKSPNPKEVAKTMIEERVVTREMAKESSIKWIESGIKKGGYPSEVVSFWREVVIELKH